jgi:hypothetical protein
VIADNRPLLERAVYDVLEGIYGFLLRRVRMSGHPLVHFSNVRCRSIGLNKLVSIFSAPLRHEPRLVLDRSPSPGDANTSMRELPLRLQNQRFHTFRTRLPTLRVSWLATIFGSQMHRMMHVMCMGMMMMVSMGRT